MEVRPKVVDDESYWKKYSSPIFLILKGKTNETDMAIMISEVT
jgi:hypothetical protein